MIINRGKKLTIIADRELLYKIPTLKFDDIIGTSDEALPEDVGEITDKRRHNAFRFGKDQVCSNFVIEFNGRKLNLSDMVEFSDMQPESFANSLTNASSVFMSDEYLRGITECILESVRKEIYFEGINMSFMFPDRGSNCKMASLGKIISLPKISTYGRVPQQLTIDVIGHITKSQAYMEQVKSICIHVNKALNRLRFEDLSGNEYMLPMVSFNTIDEGIKKALLTKNKERLSKDALSYISLSEILTLECHLNGKNSIELLNKEGQLILKGVPEVLPTTIMRLLKKYGQNGALKHLEQSLQGFLLTEKTGKQNPGE